ncbi:MAG TPA: MoaF N-terminal domain-containing protein [Thermoanaerobaculia bacterium]|jgi:phenolic acid decarboxylase
MRITAVAAFLILCTTALEVTMADDPIASDPVRGKTIRWTFTDGPIPASFEHTFRQDGSLVWRVLDGPMKGGSGEEKKYSAARVADDVYAISYLAASGHTLTVILNLRDKRMYGYGSNDKQWFALHGTVDCIE